MVVSLMYNICLIFMTGKLDTVLALEEDDADVTDAESGEQIQQTATLRRRPVSRTLRSSDIQVRLLISQICW